jgi:amino acid transporter
MISFKCFIWPNLALLFLRRKSKCEKLINNKWWEKLTWAIGSGEIKIRTHIIYILIVTFENCITYLCEIFRLLATKHFFNNLKGKGSLKNWAKFGCDTSWMVLFKIKTGDLSQHPRWPLWLLIGWKIVNLWKSSYSEPLDGMKQNLAKQSLGEDHPRSITAKFGPIWHYCSWEGNQNVKS